MKWINNVKISVRLIVSFLVVLAGFVVISVFSSSSLESMEKSGNEIYTKNLLGLSSVDNAADSFYTLRIQVLRTIYQNFTEEGGSALETDINKAKTELDAMVANYKASVANAVDNANITSLQQSFDQYIAYVQKIAAGVKAGDKTTVDNTVVDAGATGDAILKQLDTVKSFNETNAKNAADNNRKMGDTANTAMIIIAACIFALAAVLALLVINSITKPVRKIAEAADKLARGDMGVSLDDNSKDEIGTLARAFNNMINALRGYVDEISAVLTEMASGNLNVGIEREYLGDFRQIKDSINNITAALGDMIGDINNASEQVATGTQQVSIGSQALSQGSTEQAGAIEELTVALTEIARQTKQNAVNAERASELALAAKGNAEEGNTRMKEMQQAMKEINEASTNISKIIKVIDDIAFQTNLLALNAAVEAARAGQHGKGFAVVAEEVRNLAQRSANAAKETTSMIEGSIQKVKTGTVITDDTAKSLASIVSGVEKATELVGGIAQASSEQATSIAQVNAGIEQVAQVVQTNSATAEQSAAASEELSGQAAMLKDLVGRFTLKELPAARAPAQLRAAKPEKAKSVPEAKHTVAKPKIALNDMEFGKY